MMRAYTPTSSDDDMGYFDLVIKVLPHDSRQLSSIFAQACRHPNPFLSTTPLLCRGK